jgi:hypothetical protein
MIQKMSQTKYLIKNNFNCSDFKDGKLMQTERVQTANEPFALIAKDDRPILSAGGEDIAIINTAIADKIEILF